MKLAAAIVVLLACAVAGCSKGKPPAAEAAQTPAPPQKTVFDTQLKALQKAKDVQKTVDQQKQDLEQQLKDQGG